VSVPKLQLRRCSTSPGPTGSDVAGGDGDEAAEEGQPVPGAEVEVTVGSFDPAVEYGFQDCCFVGK
jgi:hypothetical protein